MILGGRSDALDQSRFELKVRVFDRAFDLAEVIVKYGSAVVGLFIVSKIVEHLAGKTTIAWVDGALRISADRWVAYIAAAFFGTGYFKMRKTLKGHVTKTGPYVAELEGQIHPGRSSSGLLPSGEPDKKGRRNV